VQTIVPSIRTHRERKWGKALSAREIEALSLIALGLTNAQIGRALGIKTDTVKNFVWSIKSKTRIHSRVLLAFYAYAHGYANKEAIKEAIAEEQRASNARARRRGEGLV
jgi:DNA-binding NarL/FixJ family response regulator